jgi:hypothetical protein
MPGTCSHIRYRISSIGSVCVIGSYRFLDTSTKPARNIPIEPIASMQAEVGEFCESKQLYSTYQQTPHAMYLVETILFLEPRLGVSLQTC